MKHPLLLSIVVIANLLLVSFQAQAAPVPADTVAGTGHFTHLVSVGMCARLAQESQKTDLTKLTGAESEALLKRLMLGAMGDNFGEFTALLQLVGKEKAESLGEAIGEQAVLEMVQRCPSSGPLMAKIGSSHLAGNLDMSDAERSVLLPIAQAACQRLDAENTKQPFDKLTPAQRGAQIERILGGTLLSSSQALQEQYGEDAMGSTEQGEEIGKKVALLMLEACPTYILAVGRDELARNRQAAAAKPKATPTKKTPTRATPLKSAGKR